MSHNMRKCAAVCRFLRQIFKADFHSLEFSEWIGDLLPMRENVTLNLNRMLPMTNSFLCKILSTPKILLIGNHSLRYFICSNREPQEKMEFQAQMESVEQKEVLVCKVHEELKDNKETLDGQEPLALKETEVPLEIK